MYNRFDCIKKGRKDLPTELTSELNKAQHMQRHCGAGSLAHRRMPQTTGCDTWGPAFILSLKQVF